jgi:hypothetical protein
MKQNLLDNLRSMATLMSDDGEGYTPPTNPQAGLGIQNWGLNQANNARFAKGVAATRHPNALNTNATPLPNAWEIFGHVMNGRRNAVEAVGGRFRGPDPADFYNDAPSNTRFDDRQIGVTTGQTLADDEAGMQDALNRTSRPSHRIITDLRKRFGLS